MQWNKVLLTGVLLGLPVCQALNAQSIAVRGTVSTSLAVVRTATVTFTSQENSSRTFSAVTDSIGRYHLSIAPTSVGQGSTLPSKFELEQNYPNPFTSSTAISYDLKSESDAKVTIFDILGRTVYQSSAGVQSAGAHTMLWDGTNAKGHKVASGVYFYCLQAGGDSQTRKMVLKASGAGLGALPQSMAFPATGEIDVLKRGVLAETFRVIIENSASTFPTIVAGQFDNVVVMSDTTLNFTVVSQAAGTVSTVYLDSVQQYIRGFGGANIIPWRPAMTTAQIQKAFGAGEGELGFSILRLRVPSTASTSEFSPNVPVAQAAQGLGAIVFGSPWSPPAELKSNNNIVKGTLNDSSYAAFATHLKSFVDYMSSNGAPLYAVSVQNEPDVSVTYESCDWNATQMMKFIKNNAPVVGTRIVAPESFHFNHAMSDSTLNDSTAASHLSIVGGHIYGGGTAPYPLANQLGKELWMTEYLELDTTWTAVLGTGRGIHDCMEAGMNAYIWWYIVRYYGPIGEDGVVTKRGYVMSQYSRFVRPGFYKIKCNPVPQRYVLVSSYKNASSKLVIVALNTSSSAIQQAFLPTGGSATSFSQYTTSKSRNCEKGVNIPVLNGGFVATLDASSITTFVSN
jgi:glucuronoarabinoxylan endo-1,4-beta-xylanase